MSHNLASGIVSRRCRAVLFLGLAALIDDGPKVDDFKIFGATLRDIRSKCGPKAKVPRPWNTPFQWQGRSRCLSGAEQGMVLA